MSVKIRLMRIGAKKRPFYRVVAVDERKKRTGAYLDLLGTYNPLTDPKEIILKQDKIDAWIKKGAVLSDGYLRMTKQAPLRPPRKPKKEKESKESSAISSQTSDEKQEEVTEKPAEEAEEKVEETLVTTSDGDPERSRRDSSEVNEPKTKEPVEAAKTETQEEKNTDNG